MWLFDHNRLGPALPIRSAGNGGSRRPSRIEQITEFGLHPYYPSKWNSTISRVRKECDLELYGPDTSSAAGCGTGARTEILAAIVFFFQSVARFRSSATHNTHPLKLLQSLSVFSATNSAGHLVLECVIRVFSHGISSFRRSISVPSEILEIDFEFNMASFAQFPRPPYTNYLGLLQLNLLTVFINVNAAALIWFTCIQNNGRFSLSFIEDVTILEFPNKTEFWHLRNPGTTNNWKTGTWPLWVFL